MSQQRNSWRDRIAPRHPVATEVVARPGLISLPEGPEITSSEILARYVTHPEFFHQATEVKLLVDGREAYPEMLAAIDSAVIEVDLETYTFADDGTGHRFRDALCRAARRGVQVRLLYDYVGSLYLSDSSVRQMPEAGVRVAVFHPPVLSKPIWG